MPETSVCLVCSDQHGRDLLNCVNCWKEHGGNALANEMKGKSKSSLKMSFATTMRLLDKSKSSPRPETRLKLCFVAATLGNEHGDHKPREALVQRYHQSWTPTGQAPVVATKSQKKPPARERSHPSKSIGQAKFRGIEEELDAICRGDHRLNNDYTGDTGQKPGKIHTDSGHWVASKEEKMLADWLYKNRIAFAYEVAIDLDSGGRLYPDFVIPRNIGLGVAKPIVIEHFGLLNKPDYAKKAALKMSSLKEICDERGWLLAYTSPATIKDYASTVAFFSKYVSGVKGQTPHD